MTIKIDADTSSGLQLESDTSGIIDIQSGGTTKMTIGTTIDIQGNELVLDADADTSIHASTDDQIDFKVGGTDRMHLDASGQLGIGTSSPSGSLHINTSSANILIADTDDSNGSFGRVRSDSSGSLHLEADVDGDTGSSTMRFNLDGTEHMRLNTDGDLIIDSTSTNSTEKLHVANLDGGVVSMFRTPNSGTTNLIVLRNSNGSVGSIKTSGTSTSFNTSSDYRLKENVEYTWDATTRLKQLKPCRFNFITDVDETLDGFLAHEVSDIVPEAVSGEKDATTEENVHDDDGNVTGTETVIDAQSIDQSKLVPLLVKTCQEQQAIIEDLQTRITALENN
jgi:hypothetical protein